MVTNYVWNDLNNAYATCKNSMHYRKGGYASLLDTEYFSASKLQNPTRAKAIISGPGLNGTTFYVQGFYEQNLSGNTEIVLMRHDGKTADEAIAMLFEALVNQIQRSKSPGGRFPKGGKAFIMRKNSDSGKYRQRVSEAQGLGLIHPDFRNEYSALGFGMLKLG